MTAIFSKKLNVKTALQQKPFSSLRIIN